VTGRGSDIARAANAITDGRLVGYSTEGVFGLGCDPDNAAALEKLLALKQRQTDKGLIVLAASREQLNPFVATLDSDIESSLEKCWPGPVTWILPAQPRVPALLTGSRRTIAARVTAHAPAAALCNACGHAIVSTSANLSGDAPCTTAQCVADAFPGQLGYLLEQPVGELDGPTPIFDGRTGQQLR